MARYSPERAERLLARVDLLRELVDHAAEHSIRCRRSGDCHSHSIVAGGFDEMSYTTRFTAAISLTMRADARASTSYGKRAQSAVMKSSVVTARSATSAP